MGSIPTSLAFTASAALLPAGYSDETDLKSGVPTAALPGAGLVLLETDRTTSLYLRVPSTMDLSTGVEYWLPRGVNFGNGVSVAASTPG